MEEHPTSTSVPNPNYKDTRCAPWYEIPDIPILEIEHPCIIKNKEKGVESLGGMSALTKLVNHTEQTVRLNLHPGNRESTLIDSVKTQTNNVVLKVSVPKRTGRKRKRGSDEPFRDIDNRTATEPNDSQPVADQPAQPSRSRKGKQFLRSLQDNIGKYQVEAVGHVDETYRFRALPDFAYDTTNSAFMEKMRNTTNSLNITKMKEFEMDMGQGPKPRTDIIPPPFLATEKIPFNYGYLENPYVSTVQVPKTGKLSSQNTSIPRSSTTLRVPLLSPQIPNSPSPTLAPFETLEPAMQRLVTAGRALLAERPIYTRRALFNKLPRKDLKILGPNMTKYISQYLGYSFESGPWGYAIIQFGVDPRTDAKYRIFQTLMFMLETEPWRKPGGKGTKQAKVVPNMGEVEDSHIFDGQRWCDDGKIWQVCDITDPTLAKILATEEVRETCDLKYDGWFQNGCLAKARVVMRQKLMKLQKGEVMDDAVFEKVVALPNWYNPNRGGPYHISHYEKGSLGKEEANLIELVRTLASRAAARDSKGGAEDRDSGAAKLDGGVARAQTEYETAVEDERDDVDMANQTISDGMETAVEEEQDENEMDIADEANNEATSQGHNEMVLDEAGDEVSEQLLGSMQAPTVQGEHLSPQAHQTSPAFN